MTLPDAADTATPVFPATVPGKTLDLTLKREPHRLVIDDDLFEVPQILATVNLRKVVGVIGDLGGIGNLMAGQVDPAAFEGVMAALGTVFRALMPGRAGERYVARLNSEGGEDDPPPIDLMRQAIPTLMWLLECYGLRPTPPSSTSASSSSDGTSLSDGTSSEAGASPSASASTDLTPPSSAT